MKRDCGEGELKPVKWEVVSSVGRTDFGTECEYSSKKEAIAEFESVKKALEDKLCSSIRLYAKDKQGYANCVRNWTLTAQGLVLENSRMDQL